MKSFVLGAIIIFNIFIQDSVNKDLAKENFEKFYLDFKSNYSKDKYDYKFYNYSELIIKNETIFQTVTISSENSEGIKRLDEIYIQYDNKLNVIDFSNIKE